jgi:serine/threonine-protein phosphatase PGAM5
MGERRVILVRHGQYDEREKGTLDLTPLGREQARRAGRALLHVPFDVAYVSTLVRAETTAAIVLAGRRPAIPLKRTSLLRECMPTSVPGIVVPATEIKKGRAQADRAFARFFTTTRQNRTELLVCHGNIIRYLICRALGVPGKTWARLGTHHAAISEIRVRADGQTRVIAYNDTGHLLPKQRTVSGVAAAAIAAMKLRR